MRKTKEDLIHEHRQVTGMEYQCTQLIDLIESDDHLQMSDYFHKAALATLERLSDVIALRAKELDHAIQNYDPDPRNEHYDQLNR